MADTTVTTLNFWGEEAPGYYSSAFSEYEQLNPGIKIVYHLFPSDAFDTVIASHMATHDSSYAVYEVDEPRTLEFANKGWLVPMDAATMADLNADVPADQLGEIEYRGKAYALPLTTSTQLLYYNKKVLAQAGVTPPPSSPTQGWTWQQLFTAATKIHKVTGKTGLLFEQVNQIYQLQPLPQGLGGGPGVTGTNGLTPDLDNAAWIQAMDWYQSCFTSGITPTSTTPEETRSVWDAGDAGFFWGGPWNYFPNIKQGLSFGVASTPHWAGHATEVPTDSWAVGVNPYSPLQSQGLALINWLALTSTGSTNLMQHSAISGGGPGNPPANKAALAKYWPSWPAPVAAIMKYQLNNESIHRALSLGWTQFETVVGQAFSSIADGSNVKAVLANAQSTLTEDFAALKTQ
jgi:multiple sugar transport system substrate-binding protein